MLCAEKQYLREILGNAHSVFAAVTVSGLCRHHGSGRAHLLAGNDSLRWIKRELSYLVVTKVNIVGLLKGNRKPKENQYPRSQAAISAIFIGLGGGFDELEGGDRRLVLVAQDSSRHRAFLLLRLTMFGTLALPCFLSSPGRLEKLLGLPAPGYLDGRIAFFSTA